MLYHKILPLCLLILCLPILAARADGETDAAEAAAANRIVVMTYAKFGVLAQKYSDFGNSFEVILCDEIHNLPRFSAFISHNPNDTPYQKLFRSLCHRL